MEGIGSVWRVQVYLNPPGVAREDFYERCECVMGVCKPVMFTK